MINGHWIAGFMDGESWFSIQISPSRSSKIGFSIAPIFRIEISERDERVLYEIEETLSLGRVRTRKPGYTLFEITSIKEAKQLLQFFQDYPLHTKKKETLALWSKAIDLILAKKHLTEDGILDLARIRDKMNVGLKRQVFGQRAYRDYTYFNNILNGQGAQRGLSR